MTRVSAGIAKKGGLLASSATVAAVLAVAALGAGSAAAEEIIVTVEHVRALDKIDLGPGGKADFFAVVTIDGKSVKSPVVKRAEDIRPNWVLSLPVGRGTYDVKLELYDQDVLSKPDPIDINRVAAKRDLDFRVNTRNCSISGFSQGYSCRRTITRAGDEKKQAEISFKVDVRR